MDRHGYCTGAEGAEAPGPVVTAEAAQDALENTASDRAILDVNQGRKWLSWWPRHSCRVATGYDAQVFSACFAHVRRCEKAIAAGQIAAALFGCGESGRRSNILESAPAD